MRSALLTALAGAPLLLAAAPAPPQAGLGWPEFDAQVLRAKSSMMADTQAALSASESAMRLAASSPPSRRRELAAATGGWLKGEALIRLNRPKEAAPVVEAALVQARVVAPGAKLEGDLLKARGLLAATQGRVQPALVDYQAAFRVFQKADAPRSEAIVLQDIGAIYADARDYAHMAKYYEQSSDIYKDDPSVALAAHNNLGNAYRQLGRLKDAQAEFARALAIARELKSPALIVRVLPNVAEAQGRAGDFAAADATLDQAFHVADSDKAAAEWKQPYLWGVRAQLAAKRGRMVEAHTALERTFAGQDLTKTPLPYRDFHETAWRVYAALGESQKALAHLTAFKRLDDEARDLAASTNAALMGAEFDFANQDLKIARLRAVQLQKDVELARSRERAQRNLLLSLGGGASVVLGLLLFGYFAMRRSRNLVRDANGRLASSNTALERALKAKSQFLATTSHEIRTPLNGILGMTQVLLADRAIQEPVRGRIELVHGAGETMRALVDDILDLAKMETGRISVDKQPFGLPRLVDDVARLWRAEAQNKGLELVVSAEDLPRTIREDEGRLRQVMFNLMSNAIKFTDAGKVTLRVRREGEALVICVADTGIGIGEADQERVFEPFTQVDGGTTRRHGGTGLGLSICRDVTHALGGEITLQSRLGEGSIFQVRLPLDAVDAATDAAAADGPAPGRPADLAQARLLVVEPNPLARSILRSLLAPHVASVEAVADLAAATAAAEVSRFDQVVAAGEALGSDPGAALTAACTLTHDGAGLTLLLTAPDPAMLSALSEAGRTLVRPVGGEALVAALSEAVAAPERTGDADAARQPAAA